MNESPTITSRQIDRLIAESKRVTSDLLALKSELAMKKIPSLIDPIFRYRKEMTESRIRVTQQTVEAIAGELHGMWCEAVGIERETYTEGAKETA
jgi:hypothetical protein